jgi:hypothetical protein
MGGTTAGMMKALGWKKFSSTGAQLGGAAGQMIGGPIGGMIGSLIGGTIGSFFKKTKQAGVTVTSGGVGDAFGTRSLQKGATGAGKSITDSLANIAQALGGSVGAFGNITIGQRGKDWRVNASGTSLKKKKGATDFGDDQSAAIAYAVQLAVSRGAIKGLSEATSRVIKGAGDNLEAAVQTAQVYEDLIRQANELADPIKGAFDNLNRGFQATIDQLKSVGYTNEDIAKLQGLFAQKQKDLLKDMTQGYQDLIDQITKGPDSGMTIYAQFQSAMADFNKLKASGTATQDEFTNAGQKVFDLARQVYGTSTPEFEAIKSQLVQATQDAITQVQTAAAAANGSSAVAQVVQTTADAAAAQRNQTNDLLTQIKNAVGAGAAVPGAYDGYVAAYQAAMTNYRGGY